MGIHNKPPLNVFTSPIHRVRGRRIWRHCCLFSSSTRIRPTVFGIRQGQTPKHPPSTSRLHLEKMAAPPPPPPPTDVDPAWAAENKSPAIIATIVVVTVLETLFAGARLYVRGGIMKKLQLDDYIIILAVVRYHLPKSPV